MRLPPPPTLAPPGSKRWRLYAPLAGFELPNKPSKDLPQELIGEPIMDITLQVE